MAAHRYWRIIFLEYYSNINGSGLAEVELRDTVGGSDLTGSGTPTASTSYPGTSPGNLVDNNNATHWADAFGLNVGSWWKYDFGAGNSYDIKQVLMRARNDSYYGCAPARSLIQSSDDNTNWTNEALITGLTWTQGSTNTVTLSDYPIPEVTGYGSYRYYRIYVISVALISYVTMNKIKLLDVPGGTDLIGGGTPSADSEAGSNTADKAIDANDNTFWQSNSNPPPHWWKYDFGAPTEIQQVYIKAINRDDYYTAGEEFYFQGSNDNSTWDNLLWSYLTYDDPWIGWGVKTFTIGEPTFFFYRLSDGVGIPHYKLT